MTLFIIEVAFNQNVGNGNRCITVCTNGYLFSMSVCKASVNDLKWCNHGHLLQDEAEGGLPHLHQWCHRSKFVSFHMGASIMPCKEKGMEKCGMEITAYNSFK
jgi:hypothetical protein